MPRLKALVMQRAKKNYNNAMGFYSQIKHIDPDPKSQRKYRLPGGGERTKSEIELDITTFSVAYLHARSSQTIIFSAEQCEIFEELVEKGDIFGLEYRLPFEDMILEFTRPVTVLAFDDERERFDLRTVLGFLLAQKEVDEEEHEKNLVALRDSDKLFGFSSESPNMPTDWSKSDTVVINHVGIIDKDFGIEGMAWTSQFEYTDIEKIAPESVVNWRMKFKALAIACIGYINCENIYLHREGEVSEAINAKRERKGKSRLEPYYICRIRGVNYDNPQATGQGTAHGIRYDVRGHFRRLATGKTTWVRPHQRGLANELYVPKIYLVDKRIQS